MKFLVRLVSASLFTICLMLTASAHAQAIDPKILQGLQGQLGVSSPAQQSRPAGAGENVNTEPATAAGRVDTREEQEVRRARSRQALNQLYTPSPVEHDYRQRLGDRQIRQFGYEFFESGPAPTGTRTGMIGDDYVLGIGDQVQVAFRGAVNSNETAIVDRDGRLVIGQLRPVVAAGRTLGSVRSALAAETKATMLATDVHVSVGEVRAISVFVGGEVARPGQYSLTSLASIGTALAQAGGIRRNGSLRQVRVFSAGGGSRTVDLYGLLGIGAPGSQGLRDGDQIIVPVIGPTIAITGAVARPAIYELKGQSTVGAVLAWAGGPLRQRGAEVSISRIGPDGTEMWVRAAGNNDRIIGGDVLRLVGGSPGGASGRVSLFGNVANAGPRPLASAGTVAELVGRADELPIDAYQLAAVLVRRDPRTGARIFEPVNLAQELRGGVSTPLMSEDRLYVLSNQDIRFLNSAPVRQIVLGQPNPLPQCRSLRVLAGLVRDTQAARFSAVSRGGFVIETEQGVSLGTIGSALGGEAGRDLEEQVATDGMRAGDLGDRETSVAGKQGRNGSGENVCPEIFEEEPELLAVLIEHSVSVGGSVRRPGAYPVGGSVSARDLALVADGLVVGATDLVLDINRLHGGVSDRIEVDTAGTMLAATDVRPGDDIRYNAQQAHFEGSGVLVSGEVARPGLYAIRRGETLSQLLARAGGHTEFAYAYGTVFTRRSVKQSQEAGFRRSARELNNSLLAIAARSTQGSGGNLAGAASLIQTLAETEAPGRMVVEADPRVLALRPDLDTVLEGGDAIYVPKEPNYVLALGDVNNPGALQFVAGKTATEYLAESGGALSTADRKRAFMVLPNGSAQPLTLGGWSGSRGAPPPPGTTIIVPKNIDPLYRLSVFRDITTIIAQLASSVATVAVLATR